MIYGFSNNYKKKFTNLMYQINIIKTTITELTNQIMTEIPNYEIVTKCKKYFKQF